jgi:methionyl-tRNA formyltransferase
MNKSKTLVFFGNERLSSGFRPTGATLQRLIEHGYIVKAVVANHEASHTRNARGLEIEAVAKEHNIPMLLPKRPADIKDVLSAYGAVAGVLVAYGRIISQEIIDIFPAGILNIHPSLLPKYRGPTPIEQAMLDGAKTTGVSVMKLVRAMDAGPVYAQKEITLTGTETKQDLTQKLLDLGTELLLDVLPATIAGSVQPKEQDESQSTYTSLIHKSDGTFDTSKPAEQLEREVRAYETWPKSRTELFGHQVIVTKAREAQAKEDGTLVLACSPGWLEIVELIAPSGKRMTGADFVRGYKPA